MKKTILLLMLMVGTISFGQVYDIRDSGGNTILRVVPTNGFINPTLGEPISYSRVDEATLGNLYDPFQGEHPLSGTVMSPVNPHFPLSSGRIGNYQVDRGGRIRFEQQGVSINDDSPHIYFSGGSGGFIIFDQNGLGFSYNTPDRLLISAWTYMLNDNRFPEIVTPFVTYSALDIQGGTRTADSGSDIAINFHDAGDGMTRWNIHQKRDNAILRNGFNGVSYYGTAAGGSTQIIDRDLQLIVNIAPHTLTIPISAGTHVEYTENDGYSFDVVFPAGIFGGTGTFNSGRTRDFTATLLVVGPQVLPAPAPIVRLYSFGGIIPSPSSGNIIIDFAKDGDDRIWRFNQEDGNNHGFRNAFNQVSHSNAPSNGGNITTDRDIELRILLPENGGRNLETVFIPANTVIPYGEAGGGYSYTLRLPRDSFGSYFAVTSGVNNTFTAALYSTGPVVSPN